MKQCRLISISFFLSLIFSGAAVAQSTGSYDTSISFMGSPRAISLYVPASYDAANKYRLMICLHGLGDSCATYRNALINSLGWGANIPNTIFVCPEALTKNSDFYSPVGGEAIIRQSIAMAMGRYHIDTANVVLQGFSLGGRAALRYGLDSYKVFKGLLLNTPAVQGVKEALNGHPAAYSFNYANASRIPIYMTHGATDIAYASSLDSTYEQLVLNDGIVRYFDFPGLAHTIPPVQQILNFIPFFNSPAHAGKDVEAVKIYAPLFICNTAQATPTILFRNTGQDTITSVKFGYTLFGVTQSMTWTGRLLPFQHTIAPVTVSNAAIGTNVLTARVDTLNRTFADTVMGNNQQSTTFERSGAPLTSLNEGFEGSAFPPAGWMLQEAGDFYTAWAQDNTVAKTGNQSAGTFNTILIFDNAGRSEGLITPPVSLPSTKPALSFDVAYDYHRYTPPYFTANVDFADTLEVMISNDCGAHYSRLYKKGGADLATFSGPILNPLSLNDCFAAPADSNWRRETIDLSSYTTGGNAVYIKFNYISALGGSINIDNVQIGSATAVSTNVKPAGYTVYPNPATDEVTISSGSTNIIKAAVLDMAGKLLLTGLSSQNGARRMTVDTRSLPAGMYLLQISSAEGVSIERLTITR